MIKFKWVKDDRDKKILFKSDLNKKNKEKDFFLEWEKNLGWDSNPFETEITLPINKFISGREEEKKKLNIFFIQNKRYGLIKSNQGEGKSILLLWLKDELNKYNKYHVLYLPIKELLYDSFLKEMLSPFPIQRNFGHSLKKVFEVYKKSSRNYVFLIDDIHELSKEYLNLLKDIYNSNKNIKIIASIDSKKEKKLNFLDEDNLNLKLKQMKFEEIREMIKKRIESVGGIDIEPFNNVRLKMIIKKSSNNPRSIISLCSKKSVELSLNHEDEIDEDEINEIKDEIKEGSFSYDNTVNLDQNNLFEGDLIVQEILANNPNPNKKLKK